MSNEETFKLRQDIIEIKSMIQFLIPTEFSISYIAKQTGKSRQAIRAWLIRNCEPEVDFWEKDGKIIMPQHIAFKYLSSRVVS